MEWLNYHHLLYFHLVVKEGGVQPAARALRLSHSTVSAQIKKLEEALGAPLFDRSGKRLELTALGHVVERYAEQIFALGGEMLQVAKGQISARRAVSVGLTGVVPKLVAREILEPVFELEEPVRLNCVEDRFDSLLAQLATHALDLVIADAPVPPNSRVRAFNHFLGESGIHFYGTPALAAELRPGFPQSLEGAPMLLPTFETSIRRSLEEWFAAHDVHPEVVADVEDSALLKVLGADGLGIFPAPEVIDSAICTQYGVEVIGRADGLKERFYAITLNRRLRAPAVIAVCERARREIFKIPVPV